MTNIILKFTFHNVSINSQYNPLFTDYQDNLHSIMYLLIRKSRYVHETDYPHLHSIMYLLIQGNALSWASAGEEIYIP